jgi:3-hydroxybutyryl-CoA dehydrogenase
MTLYRYDGDAPTIYKDKTIYPGQEVDLKGDDERILCAEHRMVESKNTDGPVSFGEDTDDKAPERDEEASDVNLEALGKTILNRILAMLINEASDAVFMNVATIEDVDLAMTRGVNYPKGLLEWADELGAHVVLDWMYELHSEYREDRYRPNPLLKRIVRKGESFYG